MIGNRFARSFRRHIGGQPWTQPWTQPFTGFGFRPFPKNGGVWRPRWQQQQQLQLQQQQQQQLLQQQPFLHQQQQQQLLQQQLPMLTSFATVPPLLGNIGSISNIPSSVVPLTTHAPVGASIMGTPVPIVPVSGPLNPLVNSWLVDPTMTSITGTGMGMGSGMGLPYPPQQHGINPWSVYSLPYGGRGSWREPLALLSNPYYGINANTMMNPWLNNGGMVDDGELDMDTDAIVGEDAFGPFGPFDGNYMQVPWSSPSSPWSSSPSSSSWRRNPWLPKYGGGGMDTDFDFDGESSSWWPQPWRSGPRNVWRRRRSQDYDFGYPTSTTSTIPRSSSGFGGYGFGTGIGGGVMPWSTGLGSSTGTGIFGTGASTPFGYGWGSRGVSQYTGGQQYGYGQQQQQPGQYGYGGYAPQAYGQQVYQPFAGQQSVWQPWVQPPTYFDRTNKVIYPQDMSVAIPNNLSASEAALWKDLPSTLKNIDLTDTHERAGKHSWLLNTRYGVTWLLLMAKRENGITFAELSRKVAPNRSPVWLTSAVFGQQMFDTETAQKLVRVLGFEDDKCNRKIIAQLTTPPMRGVCPMPDPTLLRFHELIGIYSPSFKALIHEALGDGVVSGTEARIYLQTRNASGQWTSHGMALNAPVAGAEQPLSAIDPITTAVGGASPVSSPSTSASTVDTLDPRFEGAAYYNGDYTARPIHNGKAQVRLVIESSFHPYVPF